MWLISVFVAGCVVNNSCVRATRVMQYFTESKKPLSNGTEGYKLDKLVCHLGVSRVDEDDDDDHKAAANVVGTRTHATPQEKLCYYRSKTMTLLLQDERHHVRHGHAEMKRNT